MLSGRYVRRRDRYKKSVRFGDTDLCYDCGASLGAGAFAHHGFVPCAADVSGQHRHGNRVQSRHQLFFRRGFLYYQSTQRRASARRHHGLFDLSVAQLPGEPGALPE